jgi:hypothetical protein
MAMTKERSEYRDKASKDTVARMKKKLAADPNGPKAARLKERVLELETGVEVRKILKDTAGKLEALKKGDHVVEVPAGNLTAKGN